MCKTAREGELELETRTCNVISLTIEKQSSISVFGREGARKRESQRERGEAKEERYSKKKKAVITYSEHGSQSQKQKMGIE